MIQLNIINDRMVTHPLEMMYIKEQNIANAKNTSSESNHEETSDKPILKDSI